MVYDIEMLRSFYSNFPKRVDVAREKIGRPMTLAEKILYAHLYDEKTLRLFRRGDDYVLFLQRNNSFLTLVKQFA